MRIAILARDAAYQCLFGGDAHARETIGERAGGAFDPAIATRFVAEADDVFAAVDTGTSMWDTVLEAEPRPWLTLEGEEIDRALSAIGDFADLISPSLAGHSAGVAKLSARAAEIAGLDDEMARDVRRAALVHDVGRVAIGPGVWERPAPLTADEWEQVRLHAYHTERVLNRAPFLHRLAEIARDHHEYLDGSGYHRGVDATVLSRPARLLTTADAFHAMTEPRRHRAAHSSDEAAALIADEARKGLRDAEMAEAVIEAAGQPVPEIARPAGLTKREAEVIGLIARGLLTKQVARSLDVSPKTADTHIQSAYRKIGVSTRAAATLFAMEHGMVHSGELPIHS